MKRAPSILATCTTGFFALFCASVNAFSIEEPIGLLTAPKNIGAWLVNLRYRFEQSSQRTTLQPASANILSTRLGYKTRDIEGFAALFELEDLRVMNASYNGTDAARAHQRFAAAAEGSETDRAYISYAGMFDTAFIYGRQRLVADNTGSARNAGWQQNEQIFDAFKVENTSFTDTKITLAYVDKVHGIFGDNSDGGDVHMQSPLINIEYKGSSMLDVSGYGYFLSFDNDTAASRQTSGVRVKGEYPLSGVELLYAAEYARQSDYKDGMADINAVYRHLVAGFRFAAVTAEFGYETLSGDGEYAFQTPLATGQAFNGWADQFLVTPLNGLKDVYVSADTSFAGLRWKAVYHDFSAERGSVDYGNELNLLIVKDFSKRFSLGLKYANYFADDFSLDTEKLQIYAEINI